MRERSDDAGGRAASHSLRGVIKRVCVFEGVLAAPWGVGSLLPLLPPLGGHLNARSAASGGKSATPIFYIPPWGNIYHCCPQGQAFSLFLKVLEF